MPKINPEIARPSEPVYSCLNETFDRVQGRVTVPDDTFNNVLRALEGIHALNRVIYGNGIAIDNLDEVELDRELLGGFHRAIYALTYFSIEALEEVASQKSKTEGANRE